MSNSNSETDYDIFVPGRLCILGEHTDWIATYRDNTLTASLAVGITIVCATNEGLYGQCHLLPFPSQHICFEMCTGDSSVIFNEMLDVDNLEAIARQGGIFSYVAGTAAVILSRYATIIKQGIKIRNYKTTLPMKKGLSSSAAVCVLVVKSFASCFNLTLDLQEIMELAYKGEMLTPSQCGRMDQCVAMGPGAIGVMEFDRQACNLKLIPCAKPLHFVVADLKASKDTVVILKDLNACFPEAKSEPQKLMHEYINDNVSIAHKAVAAIESGDLEALAQSISEAQNLFDRCATPNCTSQLTSPRLHEVMRDERLRDCCLAAKGVGSQGDGSIQVLCQSELMQQQALEVLTSLGCDGFLLTIPMGLRN